MLRHDRLLFDMCCFCNLLLIFLNLMLLLAHSFLSIMVMMVQLVVSDLILIRRLGQNELEQVFGWRDRLQ